MGHLGKVAVSYPCRFFHPFFNGCSSSHASKQYTQCGMAVRLGMHCWLRMVKPMLAALVTLQEPLTLHNTLRARVRGCVCVSTPVPKVLNRKGRY